jgi:hypothetical protein
MPFPPTFTNAWDTTQPPDTQAANLLGQDIRNLKTDIMQRMSLLAGTLGNRPTPETVNAVWGGAGFGLLYFATDTGQVFQWNGASWVVIFNSISGATKFSDLTQANFSNPVGATAINTVTVPNTFNTGGIVRAHCSGQLTIGIGNPTLGYTINGNASTITSGGVISVNGAIYNFEITLMALSGVSMSYSVALNISGPPGGAVANQVFNATGTFAYVTGTTFNISVSENAAFTGTVTSTGMEAYLI